jgi:hypothetical protein
MRSASSFFVFGGRREIDKEQNGEREENLLLFEWEKEDGIFFCTTNNSYG